MRILPTKQRLLEFFLSSESVKQRSDLFFLQPDRCCVPSSPHWFSSSPLDGDTMEAMLARLLTVRELQDRRSQSFGPTDNRRHHVHMFLF
ncbi:unnamed protein product [Pleuronectes platessa]|uniref:ZMYM2-like/QRICH1 C-terminal domain-containing protein n=1 Tax=Pleuronectes platessa TaxID=8262 RepID=A0A9N7UT24_PLEPL|nr:unnamed protein product [Pleuronectes platessa]